MMASLNSKWDFSFARMNSCFSVGNFASRKAKVKHSGFSVMKVFTNPCMFPSVFSEKVKAQFSLTEETLATFCTFAYNSFPRGTSSAS